MKTNRFGKTIAAGMIGLTAFGAVAAVPTIAQAQELPAEEQVDETRAERRAARQERRQARMAAMADLLGVSTDDLQSARDAGMSLADLATANGVDIDVVINALIENKTSRINDKVASGDLTQAEADEKLAALEERVTDRVNRTPGERGERMTRGEAPGDA